MIITKKGYLIPISLRRLPIAMPPGPAPTTITLNPGGGEAGGCKSLTIFKTKSQERPKTTKASHQSIFCEKKTFFYPNRNS